MWVIEKFKNRESKKKLREENARLRAKIDDLQKPPEPQFCPTKIKNLQQIQEKVMVPVEYADATEEIIKNKLARELVARLIPFVEYNVESTFYGERVYTANLYVAIGDRNYEENPNTF